MKRVSQPPTICKKKQKRVKSNSITAQWKKLSKRKRVKFGDIEISAVPISLAEYKRNVLEGQRALARAKKAIITPGVKLDLPPEAPRYHADSELCEFGCLVRVLNEKAERGTFKNGRFYPWGEARINKLRNKSSRAR